MKNKTKFPIKGSKYMNEEIIRKVCSEIIEQTREKLAILNLPKKF